MSEWRPGHTVGLVTVQQSQEAVGRVGLTARGVLYLVIAVLAVDVALGRRSSQPDREGALQAVGRRPLSGGERHPFAAAPRRLDE